MAVCVEMVIRIFFCFHCSISDWWEIPRVVKTVLISISAIMATPFLSSLLFFKPLYWGIMDIKTKLFIFNVYRLMSLEISIHLWNHHYNMSSITSESFLPLLIYYYFYSLCVHVYVWFSVYVCDKNTLHNTYLLSNGYSLQKFIVWPIVSQVKKLAYSFHLV